MVSPMERFLFVFYQDASSSITQSLSTLLDFYSLQVITKLLNSSYITSSSRTTPLSPCQALNECSFSRAKVLSRSHVLQHATRTVTSRRIRLVTPPVDRLLVEAGSEEDDDGRDGDTCGQSRRDNVVELGPEGQVSRSDVEPRERTRRSRAEEVGEVIRRPVDTASPEHDGVERSDPVRLRSALTGVVIDERRDQSERETQEEQCVLSSGTKDTVWANGTPD